MERGGLRQFRLHTGAPQRDGAIIRQRFRTGAQAEFGFAVLGAGVS